MDANFASLAAGQGEVLREGSEVLLVPVGNRVTAALKAADLEEQGISAAVINPRFIKPLDAELIAAWAAKTGHVVTIEDNIQGGFGSAVAQLLQERGLLLPVRTLGYPDTFIEHGPQATLWANTGIDAAGIARTATA